LSGNKGWYGIYGITTVNQTNTTMKPVRYSHLDSQFPASFSGMLDRFFSDSMSAALKQFTPAVDISEDEKSYQIQLAVPGVSKSDFKINLLDGKLTVSGERKLEEKKEGKNFHTMETQYGSFSRSFFLPEDVLTEKIEASYENGLLHLTLPKREKKIAKAIIEVK
jgi:HSP20 family protein